MTRTRRSSALIVSAAATLAALAVPATLGMGGANAADSGTGPQGVVSGQVDSFALRVEYDIPLPVGSGTVAHVGGEIRRSLAGENAKGVAGAPTEMDAVVSGKYIDPQGTGKPQRRLPQSECFYPGSLLDTHFYFPTETQGDTQTAPSTGYATSQCAAGPLVELHGRGHGSDTPGGPTSGLAPIVTTGTVASDALARPDKGVLEANTASRASGVSILGGVLTIGSVVASGRSSTDGRPGGAASRADVAISDINAGGVAFGLTSATVNGKEQVQLTAGGQTVAVDSSAAKSVIDAANAAIEPNGCRVTPLTSPDTYPQGYLFSRPQPDIGVKADGTSASSYRGGLLIICDPPKQVTNNFGGFSPQRAQILVGFAYTSTTARAEVGGFTFGDAGSVIVGTGGSPLLGTLGGLSSPVDGLPAIGSSPVAAATPSTPSGPTPAARPRPVAAIGPIHLSSGVRWLLGLLGLVGWAALTNLGARRFLLATVPCNTFRPEDL
ncbi:MAG: hypothetical protein QOG03_1658 [Actinomycetota bacterium]|jgi:hypothetical protein|nr:hypothetical protein [Actinomycetota bacterium]